MTADQRLAMQQASAAICAEILPSGRSCWRLPDLHVPVVVQAVGVAVVGASLHIIEQQGPAKRCCQHGSQELSSPLVGIKPVCLHADGIHVKRYLGHDATYDWLVSLKILVSAAHRARPCCTRWGAQRHRCAGAPGSASCGRSSVYSGADCSENLLQVTANHLCPEIRLPASLPPYSED